ncbi:MAG: alpha/beta hydrolase [Bacteroidetes bacterium HGW-Bacteroidetes-3]|jgi:pimeloyl-ACP methyl ester carboxylesterase|nr:MAG: alpha/beta hydrolase [Bacteroidetes bacterium HGW-Bacteroidetes-3]
MENQKTPIYFVPGLAASSEIFEFLQFPKEKFELHFLEWLIPLSANEPIEDYAKRMADLVLEENPVLIGVSFGGIMVQEMGKHLQPKKTIIISSVKSRHELSKSLKFIQKFKIYKLFPSKFIENIEMFSFLAFEETSKTRLKLYKKYFSVRDRKYLNWSIYNVLHWQQTKPSENILHIHGTADAIFSFKYINDCIAVEKGTHIMIINRAKTISKIIIGSLK